MPKNLKLFYSRFHHGDAKMAARVEQFDNLVEEVSPPIKKQLLGWIINMETEGLTEMESKSTALSMLRFLVMDKRERAEIMKESRAWHMLQEAG